MRYHDFFSDEFREYIAGLLAAQGISRKTFNIEPFQKNGSVSVSGTTVFSDFDSQVAAYAGLKRDVWFFGDLWLNPHVSAYVSGTPVLQTSLLTHGSDLVAVEFGVDLRSSVAGADTAYPSRLYFEDVFVSAVKVSSDSATSTYKVPFLFTGAKVSLR